MEKKQRGANILEVKYQKVTYRRYFTEVKYKKVSTKVGNLRSATKHALGASGPGADRGCLRQGSAPGQVGEVCFQRKGSLGGGFFGFLQVFHETGCPKLDFGVKFVHYEKIQNWSPKVENGAKIEPKLPKWSQKGPKWSQKGPKWSQKGPK